MLLFPQRRLLRCSGALALAVDLVANKGSGSAFGSIDETVAYINSTLSYLVTRSVAQTRAVERCNSEAHLGFGH